MAEEPKSLADQLQEVKLRLEQRKLRWWYVLVQVIGSPAFLAAIVSGAITYGFNWYSQEQAHRDSDRSILLGVIGQKDPALIASELRLFLNANLIYDSTHFADAIGGLEEESKKEILQNIILASDYLPLDFGPDVNMMYLVRPIDLQTLNVLIHEGYPLELLLWLFAQSFELRVGSSPDSALAYEYNPPDSYGCPRHEPAHRCFREWISILLLSGLTVEEKTIVTKLASRYDTTTVARFCFSPSAGQLAGNEMGPAFAGYIQRRYMNFSSSPAPICGTWDDKDAETLLLHPQPDNFAFAVGGATFHVVLRSTYGVFEFLGNLIKMQRENIRPNPEKAFFWTPPLGEPDEATLPPLLKTVQGSPPLITLLQKTKADCFASAKINNVEWCVPEQATITKEIFGMLSQIIRIESEYSSASHQK